MAFKRLTVLLLTYINSQLDAIGTVAEQTEIFGAKSNYLNGLAQTEANVRLRRVVETKALAEFAIIEFGINEAEALELMAWLVLLNENNIYELSETNEETRVVTTSYNLENGVLT